MLRLEGVTAGYGRIAALRDVTLEVRAGELVCLVGANGAGKTTTLKAISGLVRPSAGRIVWDGQDIHRLPPDEILRRGIAHCPEGRRVFPHMSVDENLAMGAYVRRDGAAVAADLARVLATFPVLRERRRQPAGTLSGGEQQMLAIGRALMARPRLLMLDEPSLGLAPVVVGAIFANLVAINRAGITVLLVEQNVLRALRLSHRAYVLENGTISLSGPSAALLADARIRRAYLGT